MYERAGPGKRMREQEQAQPRGRRERAAAPSGAMCEHAGRSGAVCWQAGPDGAVCGQAATQQVRREQAGPGGAQRGRRQHPAMQCVWESRDKAGSVGAGPKSGAEDARTAPSDAVIVITGQTGQCEGEQGHSKGVRGGRAQGGSVRAGRDTTRE